MEAMSVVIKVDWNIEVWIGIGEVEEDVALNQKRPLIVWHLDEL